MLRSMAHISFYTSTQYDIQNWTGYMRTRYFSLNAILAHCGGVPPFSAKKKSVKNWPKNSVFWAKNAVFSEFLASRRPPRGGGTP